ncbi:MAG: cobalamin-binding protein [Anaerolineales bacterium]
MLRKTLILTLLFALAITGCAPASTPTETPAPVATEISATEAPIATSGLTFTDGLGREVKLDGPAQHIISLAPSNTEILFAIGAGDQMVGRDAYSDYPAEVSAVTDIGDTYSDLDTELIVSLKPDLILAAEINTQEQVKALEDLGLTVYYLKNPTTLEGMYQNLEIVAQLTGHEADAAALTDSLKSRVAVIDNALAPISARPSVFYEIDGTDPAKPYTAGKGTFITLLIERAGGTNIAADIDGYPQLSLEQVVAADPSFIILGDSAFGVTAELVSTRPGWENLSAVKSKQILPFDDNLLSRPGPRMVDGLEALVAILHPSLIPAP